MNKVNPEKKKKKRKHKFKIRSNKGEDTFQQYKNTCYKDYLLQWYL